LLEWLEYESWLKRQLSEYEHAIGTTDSLPAHDASKLSLEEITEREFEVKKNIDALKDELFNLATKNSVLEKLLEGIEANESYLKIIFAQQNDPAETR